MRLGKVIRNLFKKRTRDYNWDFINYLEKKHNILLIHLETKLAVTDMEIIKLINEWNKELIE